jgi:hypothetical protein
MTKRDELAVKYANEQDGWFSPSLAFAAGWDARDEEIARLREALEKIANFQITEDAGRFGSFIGAGAVDIAKAALAFQATDGEQK